VLGVVGIFYGASTAFAQQDLKRLVAYTSISHLGFVLLGVFAGTQTALQGCVILMLAHGLSTGALFMIIGALQQRIGTRDAAEMGGLWSLVPRMGGMTLFFALASLGLPGLANFIGEFLVLAGTFNVYPWFAGIAAFGFVLSSVYSLYIIYRVFYGPVKHPWEISDLRLGETLNLSVLAVGLMWIGLFPQTILNTSKTALEKSKDLNAVTTQTNVAQESIRP
jgi:NADH-quinone oxidoreductase subunit M